jgi:hypothetical protein
LKGIKYICKGCGKVLRDDDKEVLFHVRHNEVLSKYFGSMKLLRRHKVFKRIYQSEMHYKDSAYYISLSRIYKGKLMVYKQYLQMRLQEEIELNLNDFDKILNVCSIDYEIKIMKEFINLPSSNEIPKSGIVAWHEKCYEDSCCKEDFSPSMIDTTMTYKNKILELVKRGIY